MNTLDHLSSLIIENSLSFESLYRLITGDVLAIRIPNFYEREECEHLTDMLTHIVKNESTSSGKIYLSDVDAFWNTIDDLEVRERYFAKALPTMRRLRKISFPFASPIDLLRLELDEIWPSGALLMHLEKKVMLFGITRIWTEGSEALPHQDILIREIPSAPEVQNELSQLGINIYLRPAQEGGELEIWNHSFSDEECLRQGVKDSYGFNRSLLPDDSLVISPQEEI